jgi:hypothetical protein
MFVYTLLAAIVGIVGGIVLAARGKRADGVIYGRLDKAGIVTNILLTVLYAMASPVCLFLGALSEPDAEGILWLPAMIVCLIAASATLFCGLGLGFSVMLRKRGRGKLSFAVQFAGIVGIALTFILHVVFTGTLIRPLN